MVTTWIKKGPKGTTKAFSGYKFSKRMYEVIITLAVDVISIFLENLSPFSSKHFL